MRVDELGGLEQALSYRCWPPDLPSASPDRNNSSTKGIEKCNRAGNHLNLAQVPLPYPRVEFKLRCRAFLVLHNDCGSSLGSFQVARVALVEGDVGQESSSDPGLRFSLSYHSIVRLWSLTK